MSQLRDVTKRFVGVSDNAVSNTEHATGVLKGVVQKLTMERVSLAAAVTNAEQSSAEAASKV